MEKQAQTCDIREPHSTSFKQYLLSLLPEWIEFTRGREIYLTNKSKAAHAIAETHDSQIDQNDALLLMRAAGHHTQVMSTKSGVLHWIILIKMPYSPCCRRGHKFYYVILHGPSILQTDANVDDDMGLNARMKIAATISQLLIYNTHSGTHHARKTSTIRHGKDREAPFPLYQGLKMHGEARLKKNRLRLHMHLACQCLTVVSWK